MMRRFKVWRSPGVRLLLVALLGSTAVATVGAACSSDPEAPPPYPEGMIPDAARPPTQADAMPRPSTDASMPVKPNADCVPPQPDSEQTCTLTPTETTKGNVEGAWAVDAPDGCPVLYVSRRPMGADDELRRYKMTRATPCTFVRDTSFSGAANQRYNELTADDDGEVFVGGFADVTRFAGGATVTCARDPQVLGVTLLAITPDGKTGFTNGYTEAGPDNAFARLANDPTGCNLKPFALTGGATPIATPLALAVDHKSRLHVLDQPAGMVGKERVVIFDTTGAYVSEYVPGGPSTFGVGSIARCGGGICADRFADFVAVTDDGALRSQRKFIAGPMGISFPRLVGTDSGALFRVGDTAVSNGATDPIVVARQPAP